MFQIAPIPIHTHTFQHNMLKSSKGNYFNQRNKSAIYPLGTNQGFKMISMI